MSNSPQTSHHAHLPIQHLAPTPLNTDLCLSVFEPPIRRVFSPEHLGKQRALGAGELIHAVDALHVRVEEDAALVEGVCDGALGGTGGFTGRRWRRG
ncbi:hypothetical protein PSPO01_06463 [Paraphaeosphaeria sporulosa]